MARPELGIGLPAMIPGVAPELISRWAERADGASLAWLATGELLTTDAHDALISLAVAAAVTSRARLLTNVLVLPLHNAGVVAKQAASLDAVSGGRLSLGLGVGGKKPILFELTRDPGAHANFPDYTAAPAPAEGRIERFREQIEYMQRIWRGEPPVEGAPPIGPRPARAGGPELLAGGFAPRFLTDAVDWAGGLTTFHHVPDTAKIGRDFRRVREAWRAAGRLDPPRLIATHYFALGPDAEQGRETYVKRHYAHLSTAGRQEIGRAISVTSIERLRTVYDELAEAGASAVIPVPMIPRLDQVDRLADALG